MKAVDGTEDLMLITINGILIRMDINDISVIGRSTQGVRLIRLGDDELVATVAKVEKDDDEENSIDEDSNTIDESQINEEDDTPLDESDSSIEEVDTNDEEE